MFAFGLPKANASVEFAYLRKNIGGAVHRQFLRAQTDSKGGAFGAFLAPLLGARQEVASKSAQRTREAVCAYGYAKKKNLSPPARVFHKNHPPFLSLSPFLLFDEKHRKYR